MINSISDLKIGDYVRSTVGTYSQKYLLWEGYEDYNCTKIGTIIKLGNSFFDTIIMTDEGDEIFLASDPGSSGYVNIEILKKD